MIIRNVCAADVARCYQIETSAYEGDEAASYDRIARRACDYAAGFIVLEQQGVVEGFINSGCAWQVVMADEKFKELTGHDASAPHCVIMSLAVHPKAQGKGYARALMTEFICRMREANKQTIYLMCRQHHITFYQKLGYTLLGESASDHGGMRWFEMSLSLG